MMMNKRAKSAVNSKIVDLASRVKFVVEFRLVQKSNSVGVFLELRYCGGLGERALKIGEPMNLCARLHNTNANTGKGTNMASEVVSGGKLG